VDKHLLSWCRVGLCSWRRWKIGYCQTTYVSDITTCHTAWLTMTSVPSTTTFWTIHQVYLHRLSSVARVELKDKLWDPWQRVPYISASVMRSPHKEALYHVSLILELSSELWWSLNFRGLIWLLKMDWSIRENINTAALVTIVQCNSLVVLCSMQLIGPADWVLSHWHSYAVLGL